MHSLATRLAIVVGSIVLAANANAALLTNGGFETGDFTGWTVTNPSPDSVTITVPNRVSTGAFAANFGLNNTSGGVLSQSVTTTSLGQTYVLVFDFGLASTGNTGSMLVEILDVGNNVLASQTFHRSPTNPPVPEYFTGLSLSAVATSTTTTVRFSDVSLGDTAPIDTMLDTVSLSLVPAPAPLLGPLAIGALVLAIGIVAGRRAWRPWRLRRS